MIESCVYSGYGYAKTDEGLLIEEVYNIGQYERRDIEISDVSSRAEFIARYTPTLNLTLSAGTHPP